LNFIAIFRFGLAEGRQRPAVGYCSSPNMLEVVTPALFGFMFPDVGPGLVLAAFAALYSWRRPQQARFLIPCGLAAAGVGLLFGEVFGFHGLVPTLWMLPMGDPVQILVVPLLFGVSLMLLVDGAVLLIYASALAGIFTTEAF